MRRPTFAGIALVLCASCAASPGVETRSAEHIASASTTTPETAPPTTATPPETTEPPETTDTTDTTEPPDTTTSTPTSTTEPPPSRDLLDIGDAKPARAYDDLLRATLADLERWWSEEFPTHYGEPYEPLSGAVFAAYPQRTAPIPGCGTGQPTTYEEIALYGAFYCAEGDFIVYDDGDGGILAELASEVSPSILAVVFAHEHGHAVQNRAGTFGRDLPTITSEQQADCFAGAWVARAVRGEAPGVPFTDEDLRNGLIGIISVRDPQGINTLEPGGHGSAFDRVGAFQVGYLDGLARCVELIDEPLPLVPNVYATTTEEATEGNAPFESVSDFLPEDLNQFWPQVLAAEGAQFPALELAPVADAASSNCADPAGDLALGAALCPATNEVVFDQSFGLELYTRFGDFAVGYMFGVAWSEAVQQALESPLEGEERALASDCLAGAWVADIIPTGEQVPQGVYISPGDLDEAIQTAIVVGDDSSADDVVGSGFEKIAAFRQGVLEGVPACTARLDD